MTRRLLQRNGRGNPPFLDGGVRALFAFLFIFANALLNCLKPRDKDKTPRARFPRHRAPAAVSLLTGCLSVVLFCGQVYALGSPEAGGSAKPDHVIRNLKSDSNKDNRVDAQDLLLLLREWHKGGSSVGLSDSEVQAGSARRSGQRLSSSAADETSKEDGAVQGEAEASVKDLEDYADSTDSNPRAQTIANPRSNHFAPDGYEFKQRLSELETTLKKGVGTKMSRIGRSKDGYVDFFIVPPQGDAVHIEGIDPDVPERVAYNFLSTWKEILMNHSPEIDFESFRVKIRPSGTIVRFRQTYAGIPFFKAEVTVQLDSYGEIRSMLSGLITNTRLLDSGQLRLSPSLSATQARDLAASFASSGPTPIPKADLTTTSPELMIYDPSVVGGTGPVRLAWSVNVTNTGWAFSDHGLLIDAHNAEVAFRYPLTHNALARDIYDKNGSSSSSVGTLERSDNTDPPGSGTSGIDEVDLAWDIFNSVYSFYNNQNGRDSFDDVGSTITASVRSCYISCANAFWSSGSEHMYFGDGFVTDDVCGHEFTHGVNDHESNLVYSYESGAIDESMADMWGEWIDQTYAHTGDDDSAGSKWLIGEDLSGGALRDMADPPQFSDPDRYKGQYWFTGAGDFGGVHTNSGVGNKLCYLLTDGDTHNGFSISSMGISDAVDLFYEVQLNIVQDDECYHKMYEALVAGANTLSLSQAEKLNLEKACQSVNIRKETGDGLIAKDTNSNTVCKFEDSGKPDLKKTLSESQGTITPGTYGIVVKDTAGTVVAYLDADSGATGGEMQIKGALTENTDPPDSADNIFVISFEGVNVTTIDKNGNLKLWGELSSNVTF